MPQDGLLARYLNLATHLDPVLGAEYNPDMRIIARRTLREYWEQHPDAEHVLQAWYNDAKEATWISPSDIKQTYVTASILLNNRVVFNIRGNQYRLVVAINYAYNVVYIRFVGTHQEYDTIDATTV